jgi:uncharacterized protein YbjT (DUF2867 family)
MAILVVGSSGTIGTHVVRELAKRNADVHALTHKSKPRLPQGVTPVNGDVTDIESMRRALVGINTVFLLNPVVPDELHRALLMLDLVVELGIQRVVYFSMFHADIFLDCPHASAKYAAELMINRFGIPTTILRPNYFFQNDGGPVLKTKVYPMPIGSLGTSMVDARDIAEVAALSLIRRGEAPGRIPTEIIEIHGPDVITGEGAAALWSDVRGEKVSYPGDDLRAFEKKSAETMPSAMAYDVATMFRGFKRDGTVAPRNTVDRVTKLLGRPLRTYRSYVDEMAKRAEIRNRIVNDK